MGRLQLADVSSPRSGALLTLAASSPSASWSADPGFPTIAAPDYAAYTAAPGTAQEEIIRILAHTAGATSSTVLRNAEKTQNGQNSDAAQTSVGWVHCPTPLDFTSLPDIPAYSFVPANLQKFRKAIANIQSGTANAKALFIGTSVTQGGGVAGFIQSKSVPGYFASLINARLCAAQHTFAIPQPYSNTVEATSGNKYDPRFVLGTGWTLPATNGSGAGLGIGDNGYIIGASASTGILAFTPGNGQTDTADIWWYGANNTGVFQVNANGGTDTPTTTTQSGGTQVIQKTTITFTRGTGNVINIHGITGGFPCYILGIDAYDSTVKQLHVGNAGIDGQGTAAFYGAAPSVSAIEAYAPDITFIELAADDAIATSPPTTATFMTGLTATIAAAQASGDAVLWSAPSPNPSGPATGTQIANMQAYTAALDSYAAKNGIPYLDLVSRFGPYSQWGTALGFVFSDGVHANAVGNADIANALYRALASVV